ncbi:MAG: protease modulator HflC [Clostridiaceae bacterium]|nr:protease modulator HflC [Clostridiaceae bacterium]
MQDINFEYGKQYRAQKKVNINTGKLKDFLKNLGLVALFIIALVFLIRSFVFTVGEREQVVITQFDKIVRMIVDDINEPSIQALKNDPRFSNIKIQEGKGLFFKVPFIQSVRRFTNQLLTFDTEAEEVFTRDKKIILLDNFAQWRIVNPVSFMVNIGGNRETAHLRIDEFLYSKMREEIGKIDAHTLIADKDYVMNMLENVEDHINSQLEPLGIKIMDIRIKRTEFPDETKPSIYEQMRSERQAVATEYRAQGQKQARTIQSEAERNATIIEAQAYEEAQKIMGEGDAEALKIYAEAYNVDPEFYEFWKTLQTYKSVIDEDTTIIISPDSPFAKYIFGK